jgi:hypothetical protein
MVLSVDVIALLFPSPEGFYGAFICNEESSSLGIERPKIQPLKDCRNYANCGISTADVKGKALARFFWAEIHLDRPVLAVDPSPAWIGKVCGWDDLYATDLVTRERGERLIAIRERNADITANYSPVA